jgi:MFS family permease
MAIGMNTLAYSPHMSIIPKWFIRKRGLASGLVVSGVGLGALVVVPFNELMIEHLGWRSGFLILSGIILFILVPVTALFHRASPSELGQYPDGIFPEHNDHVPLDPKRNTPPSEVPDFWTFKAAISARAFWFIMLAVFCDSFIISMLVVHQAVHIVDVGYSKLLAASLVGLVGILGSIGGILCGFLSDHIGSKTGYTLGSVFSFIGILFLLSIKDALSPWMLYAFAILFGLGNGGKLPMIATITGDLFPGNALGRIMAIQSIGFGIGGAIGAYLGGYFYDKTESYFVPFLLLLACIMLSVLSIWMAAPHRRQIPHNAAA